MISVFDGGEGVVSGGRSVKSRERAGEWRRLDGDGDERDTGACVIDVAMFVCV